MSDGPQIAIPAVYMRGGTSRALMFHARDLPGGTLDARDGWAPLFAAALGSPDPRERQLDGLGGGISSLSKIAVIAPSDHPDADVEFLFGQVSVQGTTVSYRGNCGNISSAVGPFAIDEGLVQAQGDSALVRIRHTVSGKIIHARFPLEGGKAAVKGDFAIQGVAGTGAAVRLDFLDPGGSATGKLLPTGHVAETILVGGVGPIEVSLIDAANPVVFADARAFGLSGDESPATLSADKDLLVRFEALRAAAAVAMGIVATEEEAYTKVINLPLVALVSAVDDGSADLRVRMISTGQPHKATPLTGAMCTAVAARIPGTLVAALIGPDPADPLRIAHASGILPVDAEVVGGVAKRVTVFRTARRLMDGRVFVPC
jgi:2-methylaconitate cis-trans-isomerase PrpF